MMKSRARFLFPLYMLILLVGSGGVVWASRAAMTEPYDLQIVIIITVIAVIGATLLCALASHFAVGIFRWPRNLSMYFGYNFFFALLGYFFCFGSLSYATLGAVDHSKIKSYEDLSTFNAANGERVVRVGHLTLNESGIAARATVHHPSGKARIFSNPDTTVYCAIPIVRSVDNPDQVDGWLLLEKPLREYSRLVAMGQLDQLVDFNTIKLLAPVPDISSDRRHSSLIRKSTVYNNETAHKPGFYILRVLPLDSQLMRWYLFSGIALLSGIAIYFSARMIKKLAD